MNEHVFYFQNVFLVLSPYSYLCNGCSILLNLSESVLSLCLRFFQVVVVFLEFAGKSALLFHWVSLLLSVPFSSDLSN